MLYLLWIVPCYTFWKHVHSNVAHHCLLNFFFHLFKSCAGNISRRIQIHWTNIDNRPLKTVCLVEMIEYSIFILILIYGKVNPAK